MSGFLQGFGNILVAKQQKAKDDELKKLQLKAYKANLDLAEERKKYAGQVGEMMQGMTAEPMPPAELGGGPARPAMPGKTYNEIMQTPEGQFALLRSGMATPKDIGLAQQRSLFEKVLAQLPGAGGGGLPGQIVSAQGAGAGVPTAGAPVAGGRQIDPLSVLQATTGLDLSKLSEDIVSQKMRTPLSPSDLTKFQNAKGEFPTAGMTPYNLQKGGYKPIQTSQIALEQKMRGAKAVVLKMEPLVNKIFTDTSLWERIKGKGENIKQKVLQSNPNVVLYDSLKNGMKAMIIKALGESGNLAEGDYERIDPLFPELGTKGMTLPDSKEIAKLKLNQLKSILESVTGGSSLADAIASAQAKGGAAGAPQMPTGVDPALLPYMTPEERALFNQ